MLFLHQQSKKYETCSYKESTFYIFIIVHIEFLFCCPVTQKNCNVPAAA